MFWLIILTVLAITIVVYVVDRSRTESKDAAADEQPK